MTSYRDYIHDAAHATDDPAGDFVADARDDRNLPHAHKLDELLGYLGSRHPDVERAARESWARFTRWRARQRSS